MKHITAVVVFIAMFPMIASAQAPVTFVDSAAVGAAVAAELVASAPADSASPLVIDTTGNRWNVFVRSALTKLAPRRLAALPDSVAHRAQHFTVSRVTVSAVRADIVVRSDECYQAHDAAFTVNYLSVGHSASGWDTVAVRGRQVTTGEAIG